jgi:hypothetical protein
MVSRPVPVSARISRLFVQMACGFVLRPDGLECRPLDLAAVEGMRAARMEMASGGRMQRARQLALEGRERALARVDARNFFP